MDAQEMSWQTVNDKDMINYKPQRATVWATVFNDLMTSWHESNTLWAALTVTRHFHQR